jgi:ABC-type nitrate/sulfonate/bicarbonate transport system ATPase subunit
VTEATASVARTPVGTAPLLTLNDVSFSYPNGLFALDGITLSVPEQGVTAIVGPSGCGKSTLLKIVAGLMAPTAGTVERHFAPMAESHPLLMVFQQDTLLPWLRVKDNVALFWRLRGSSFSKTEIRKRVDDLLQLVGLESFADAYPRELSGGMRRRVAFLAGVAPQPQLLLLDEPFSSVDEPTRVQIHQEVHRIITQLKMSIILVTHDLAEAISLSDRVVILAARPGRVATQFDIPLGRDRDMLELRDTPEFLELYGHLWHSLSAEIKKAQAVKGGPKE